MSTLNVAVLVVGGGPGGYVAAIRCGQLGLDTVLVESGRLGGTCLVRGCIPSKAIIHAADQYEAMRRTAEQGGFGITLPSPPQLDFGQMVAWKSGVVDQLNRGVEGLLKRARVRVVHGWASFTDAKTCRVSGDGEETVITAEHVILANGSVPVELPALPFGGPVISSTDALSLEILPKRLVVVGAGYIGIELGTAFSKLGSTVTLVESRDRILPLYDRQLADPVSRWLARNGVGVHLQARALGLTPEGLAVEMQSGETASLGADKILVTVGRRPATQGWGLENMAVAMTGGFVQVDERCATSTRNVWAIGDLAGEPMLAHKASAQAEMVAEIIAGRKRQFAPVAIPSVCFSEPEIVAVGIGPEDAPKDDVVVSMFPFQANGRALSMGAGEERGFVRVVAQRGSHRIIGVQGTGQHISELIGQFTQAVEMGAVLEDIAGIIHAHPTLGEAFHEAALAGLGHAIHA